jgi:acetyl-CoA C-acetyltransferase
MRLVASYIRMHPRPFIVSVVGAIVFAGSSILLTTALGRATDEVLTPAFEGTVPAHTVWAAVFWLMLFACGRALGIMVQRYYSGVAGERVMASLRNAVADRYRELQLQYHRETPTGELLAHMEADVKAAVDVFWPVPFAVGVIALTLLAMGTLLRADPWLALIGLILFPTLALMNRSFAKRMEEPARRAQEDIGDVSAVAHESIDGALVVKTLGREDAETERLSAKAEALRSDRVAAGYVRATFEAALDSLPTLATAVLLAVGSWRVASGAITVGDLVGFIALFGLLSWPMRFIGWILAELPRAVVGYARLEEVFAQRVTVQPPAHPESLPQGPLGVDVRGLRHLFDGQPVLDGVTFDVQPMESVAIVGPTGVGKSTLAQLLVRLADPDGGQVLVGGVEKMTNLPTERVTDTLGTAGDTLYEIPAGFTFPGFYAAMATAYMACYKTRPEAFMSVAIKNHNNGALNEKAQFGVTIQTSMEKAIARALAKGKPAPTWASIWDYLQDPKANPMIAWPMRLFDCSPVSDGAAAVLLVAEDLAKSFSKTPVYITGTGQASDAALHGRQELTSLRSARLAAEQAYRMAGVSPQDIKTAEVHDCFTIAEVIATEDLGFFGLGEGSLAAEEGQTARDGAHPINTSGGLKSKGHPVGASGVGQVIEVWKQMRGEAGKRQLARDVDLALTHNVGGTGQTCSVHIFERR